MLWPPNWVFPAVWAIVNYPSLGIATWLVWRRRGASQAAGALRLFAVGLIFNALFLPVVNGARSRRMYVIMDSIALLLTLLTAVAYQRVTRVAALAIMPLLAWSGFTTLIKVLWWRMEGSAAAKADGPRRPATLT